MTRDSNDDSFVRYMEHVPSAFALTRGNRHALVYANAAFRELAGTHLSLVSGNPIASALGTRDTRKFALILDRAYRTGVVARNRRIDSDSEGEMLLSCSVWPGIDADGYTEHLVIELRPATNAELAIGLQREMAERLLLAALRAQDAAAAADRSRRGAAFLASESRRLGSSLDEQETRQEVARMALPCLGAWCIVDTLDEDNAMHRLAIVHPDPAKQTLLEELDGRWMPGTDDQFGLPAALRAMAPSAVTVDAEAVLANAAHDDEVREALRQLEAGPLLTVPLVIRDRLIGAVTFVGGRQGRPFAPEDIALAEDLASRSAMALDRARLYAEAVALKVRAESANEAKSAFLGMMSHELRTPLNAIGGYVDLIEMELHGPVTEAQRVDLSRIRVNQRYLMGLINDLLNLTRVGSGHLAYHLRDLDAQEVIAASIALVEPLIAHKLLSVGSIACPDGAAAMGDREKVIQILVNLLSNAIKFTPPGGGFDIACATSDRVVTISVSDNGIGIPADKLEAIFEPFVQVKRGSLEPGSGVGLGLAISRTLARAMSGDLTVESTLGEGSRFTLRLPRTEPASTGGAEVAK